MGRVIEFLKKNYKAVIAVLVAVFCAAAVVEVVLIKNRTDNEAVQTISTKKISGDASGAYEKKNEEAPEKSSSPSAQDDREQPEKKIANKNTDSPKTASSKTDLSEVNSADAAAEEEENHSTDRQQNAAAAKERQKTENTNENKSVCTISISCATVNNNLDKLDKSKKAFVPSDGWILPPTEVAVSDGESVFDVLEKVTKQHKIHLEFSKTPAYNSVYVEGINNLYEFDCGDLSGWEYKVNGEFPSYGISLYKLKTGDVVELLYTCDLGKDIGNGM